MGIILPTTIGRTPTITTEGLPSIGPEAIDTTATIVTITIAGIKGDVGLNPLSWLVIRASSFFFKNKVFVSHSTLIDPLGMIRSCQIWATRWVSLLGCRSTAEAGTLFLTVGSKMAVAAVAQPRFGGGVIVRFCDAPEYSETQTNYAFRDPA